MLSSVNSLRRVAIITGAASGIGKAVALRLAKDGLKIAVSDLQSQSSRLEEVAQQVKKDTPDGEVLLQPCDVSQEIQVQQLVDSTVKRFGRLDCMVANAGIGEYQSFSNVSAEDFNKVMAVNVNGTLFSYRAAAEAMIQCGTAQEGRIIGACSQAGKRGVPLLAAYCASKFAVRALTQTAALEWGSTGITVNAYAPGYIDTPLVQNAKAALKDLAGISGDEFVRRVVEQSALKRIGHVDDVASLVSFLASRESSFITGQCISIDGGNNLD